MAIHLCGGCAHWGYGTWHRNQKHTNLDADGQWVDCVIDMAEVMCDLAAAMAIAQVGARGWWLGFCG